VNSVANKTTDNNRVGSKPQHLPNDDNAADPDRSQTSEDDDMGAESNTSEAKNIVPQTNEKH
jgi:predicted small lipoprotein YifL